VFDLQQSAIQNQNRSTSGEAEPRILKYTTFQLVRTVDFAVHMLSESRHCVAVSVIDASFVAIYALGQSDVSFREQLDRYICAELRSMLGSAAS